MYSDVKNVLHSHASVASEKLSTAARNAQKDAGALASAAASAARAGRSIRDAEIANHYNSKAKYGMAGSNGTFWSNYFYHTINNHELISLFLADKRNPYNRPRRLFVIFSKISLSLLLSAAFSTMHNDRYRIVPLHIQFGNSFFISLILCPFGYILDHIASCRMCTKANCCVRVFTSLSYCTLLIIALISILFLIGGVLIAVYELKTLSFLQVFALAVLLDYASYFYYGIWNWYLLSWEGFLFIPVFPLCGPDGCPGRFLPVFAFWPIKKFLQLYGLCESTYAEDKEAFEIAFPGRIAVDKAEISGDDSENLA